MYPIWGHMYLYFGLRSGISVTVNGTGLQYHVKMKIICQRVWVTFHAVTVDSPMVQRYSAAVNHMKAMHILQACIHICVLNFCCTFIALECSTNGVTT